MHAIDPLYSVSGFVGGLLVGMTGVGGGSLMTPLLILLFGVHPATAVGTDLLFAAATKTGGSLVHGLAHTIDWTVVRRLASGSVPSTAVGSSLKAAQLFDVFLGRSVSSRPAPPLLFLSGTPHGRWKSHGTNKPRQRRRAYY